MSPKLPHIRPQALLRALGRAGFVVLRQSGSHVILRRGERFVNVPMHAGRDVPLGTLHAILEAAGLTIAELHDLF